MKILQDRSEFDTTLKDFANVFLLLFGQTQPGIANIHDKAVEIITEPYRKTVWITDLSVLNEDEKKEWSPADDYWVLLRAAADGKSWRVACRKQLSELCQTSGEPAPRKIRAAFSET